MRCLTEIVDEQLLPMVWSWASLFARNCVRGRAAL